MKYILSPLAFALLASVAAAHEGAHFHPHAEGSNWLPLLAGLTVITAALSYRLLRK